MRLDGDCYTNGTIYIPDGMTLDGQGHSITGAEIYTSGRFEGAVVANAGSTAHVRNLTVKAAGLIAFCHEGLDRLMGILFHGASGSIINNTVTDIYEYHSDCDEGGGIIVEKPPYDGTGADRDTVLVRNNTVTDYQKAGIVGNGDVYVDIVSNDVGESISQDYVAAIGIQLGFGATGLVSRNDVEGNQYKRSLFSLGSGILVYEADVVEVSNNKVGGNSDDGIVTYSDDGLFEKNTVVDINPDHPNTRDDRGLVDYGTGNVWIKNTVEGFEQPFFPNNLNGTKNRVR
jgi:hypothetical protein